MSEGVMHFIAITGLVTALICAYFAITQNDFKRILAFSTNSQLGLMFLALGAGIYSGGLFHLVNMLILNQCYFVFGDCNPQPVAPAGHKVYGRAEKETSACGYVLLDWMYLNCRSAFQWILLKRNDFNGATGAKKLYLCNRIPDCGANDGVLYAPLIFCSVRRRI